MEGLIGEAGANKAGLLSIQKFKEYPHFLKGYNSTYKIASNVKDWERCPILVLHNYGDTSYLDIISYIAGEGNNFNVRVSNLLNKAEKVRYYKKDRNIYVCFKYDNNLPNNTYILSSHGAERVGDATYIDEGFIEIV